MTRVDESSGPIDAKYAQKALAIARESEAGRQFLEGQGDEPIVLQGKYKDQVIVLFCIRDDGTQQSVSSGEVEVVIEETVPEYLGVRFPGQKYSRIIIRNGKKPVEGYWELLSASDSYYDGGYFENGESDLDCLPKDRYVMDVEL